jgi:hypothetical protein
MHPFQSHKRQYELLLPFKRRMLTIPACKVQQLFFDCLWQSLANLDDILPDISHIPKAKKELVATAVSEQRAIGWDLCFRGYLSRHWALAAAACPFLPPTDECPTTSLLVIRKGTYLTIHIFQCVVCINCATHY